MRSVLISVPRISKPSATFKPTGLAHVLSTQTGLIGTGPGLGTSDVDETGVVVVVPPAAVVWGAVVAVVVAVLAVVAVEAIVVDVAVVCRAGDGGFFAIAVVRSGPRTTASMREK